MKTCHYYAILVHKNKWAIAGHTTTYSINNVGK